MINGATEVELEALLRISDSEVNSVVLTPSRHVPCGN